MKSDFYLLGTAFVLQAACTVFFVIDAGSDPFGYDHRIAFLESDAFEVAVTIALVIGVIITGLEFRKMIRQQRRLTRQIDVASGAFAEIIDAQFDEWQLTASERDVALLAIKGLSIAEIAELRDTKEGTIKAQCGAVYRKAGVSGRLQLISLFIEDLMDHAPLKEPILAE